ncbi:MAG: sugar phosphate nucleotidyltransferase [Microscillaceae bacterium]|jgi:UDP-N-acetylglucosamine diphosphorylase/glucosamine-1-phosphate N-acetyltransferase|nr:sugar phosphate nucleotidyltransferase [Microscillaceae bacterium]
MLQTLALILAAGKGTRMKSDLPKPLVPFVGKPIVLHLIEAFAQAGIAEIALVVGHQAELVQARLGSQVHYVHQTEQKGTAHAVAQAQTLKNWENWQIFVFVGDSPLVSASTIQKLFYHHQQTQADCTFLTAHFPIALPYGRVIRNESGKVIKCVEERNCNPNQLKIKELITSHYIFKADKLFQYLAHIQADAQSQEYYLTDIIEVFLQNNLSVEALAIAEYWELVGLNTPEDLAWASGYKTD